MPSKSLGSMMESSGPSEDPSPKFNTRRSSMTYFDYDILTPERLERILHHADNYGRVDLLYKLYDDMEVSDTRYSGIKNQLKSTIAGMPLRIVPREGRTKTEDKFAEEYHEYANEVKSNIDTHSLTQDFTEPYFTGANLFSLEWDLEELPYNRAMYFPVEVEKVQGKHLYMNMDNSPGEEYQGRMFVRTKAEKAGEPIRDLPHSNHVFLQNGKNRYEYPKTGVARKILPWYLSLRYVKDWYTQYVENYGDPLRIGKYYRGAPKSKRKQLKSFLRNLGKDGYGTFPQGMDVQLKDINTSGKLNVHEAFIKLAHQEYSIHILGQAGTTGEGSEGSYAQSVVLNGIRRDIINSVSQIVAKGYQKIVKKGLKLNYGDNFKSHLVPQVKPIILDSTEAKQKAQAAEIVSQKMGAVLPENYIYEQVLGIEKPKKGEIVFSGGKKREKGARDEEPTEVVSGENNGSDRDQSTDQSGETSVANDPEQDGT